jgi:hypothetical protein
MNNDTIRFLLENKIAKSDRYFPWSILVEENVGLLYMSLLATHSSGNTYSTSTDTTTNQSILFEHSDQLKQENLINLILNDIPSPSEYATIEDILKFKHNRREDLLRFRMYIESLIHKIREGGNFESILDEYEFFSNEIRKMMGESKLPVLGGTLEIVLPTVFSLASQQILGGSDDVVAGIVGVTTTLIIKGINAKFQTNNQYNGNNALSYLYHARKQQVI